MLDSKKIPIAKIQAHQGLDGWLKIYSYSETKDKFANYKYFFVLEDENYTRLEIEKIKVEKSIKVKFKNFNSREELNEHIGGELYIDQDQLGVLEENQFYCRDLIGLNVYIDDNKKIGVLSDIIETGSNDVLVIKGDKEFLVPYIYGESVKKVNLEENKIFINEIYYERRD